MTLYDRLLDLRDEQRKARLDEPVVISGAAIDWEDTSNGRMRWYLHPSVDGPPRAYNAYTLQVSSRHKSGRQRMQGGMLLYLLQGQLITTVNGEVCSWREGDLLALPILREGVEFQHFNIKDEGSATLLAVEANTAASLGVDKGSGFELTDSAGPLNDADIRSLLSIPVSDRSSAATLTDGPIIDPAIDIQYHRDIERWKWIKDRHARGRILVRGVDMPWEQNRQGRVKLYLNPEYRENALRDWTFFLHDIRIHTGSHRHQGGIFIYVVEGEGYTLVDGVRHDWSAGDLILLPLQPGGVEHEHHNLDPDTRCRWVATFYWPWWELVASEFTQLRDHPDYHPGRT